MSTHAPTEPPPTQPAQRDVSSGPPLTKLTVNITPRATTALEEAARINAETKTTVVNRAIQAYAFLTRMVNDGWDLTLTDSEGRQQAIKFF